MLLFTALALGAPFEATVIEPVPWTLSVDAHDALLEEAAGMAPADATSVRVLATGPDGRVRPLEAYLPTVAPPVPEKEVRSAPVDLPGEGEGALSGKAVYLSQCHGWTWYDSLDAFSTQRGALFETVEDFHNPEGANQYLTRYLENAGARVYTTRERDLQSAMAIADNDGEGYSESGSDFEDGLEGFEDASPWSWGENPFDWGTTRRFPADGGSVATWEPAVPEDGVYAVYVSWDADSTHASDAHYRITHPGGVLDRTFDQTVHGSTWQYVETLWLTEGTSLTVELIADSDEAGAYLSADAVRIGGGVGDVRRNDELTGRPRWEESAILYTQFNGAPSSVYDPYSDGDGSDPSSRSRWAAWEHPTGEDAVYLSWHSNAGGGVGTSTYTYEGSAGDAVDGSEDFAELVQTELVDTFQLLWDPDWTDRGTRQAAFSEVNPSHNSEMPAALVELAFHDDEDDAAYLKDPHFRRDAARAMYRAIVAYFAAEDGVSPVYLPEPPMALSVRSTSSEAVEVSWEDGPVGFPWGDAAESYLVQTSTDGRSWDAGLEVATSPVALAVDGLTFVRVSALNEGGASFPSEVLGARPTDGEVPVLLVAAFDRLEESNLPLDDLGGSLGELRRMDLTRTNNFDIAVAHGLAIDAANWAFDSTSDEALGDVSLSDYPLIVWAAGEESTVDETFDSEQQALLTAFIADGGALWASGAEILWDLDYRGDSSDQSFATEVLGAALADDDAGTTDATGEGILAGLVLDFGEEDGAPYPIEYPDVLDADGEVLASYSDGSLAGVLTGSVALFGFPFECIGDPEVRDAVALALLEALVPDYEPPEDEVDTDTPGDTATPEGSELPGVRVRLDTFAGCGCGHASPAMGWPLLLLLTLTLRRRRVEAD